MKRGIRESNEVERMTIFGAYSMGNQGSHQQAEGKYLGGTDQCKGGWVTKVNKKN